MYIFYSLISIRTSTVHEPCMLTLDLLAMYLPVNLASDQPLANLPLPLFILWYHHGQDDAGLLHLQQP